MKCYNITEKLPSLNELTQNEIIITRIIAEGYGVDVEETIPLKLEIITDTSELQLFIAAIIRHYHRISDHPSDLRF